MTTGVEPGATARRSLWSYRRQVSWPWRYLAFGCLFATGINVANTPPGVFSAVGGAVGLAIAVGLVFAGCAAARRRT
ncbi:hypothetical protein [Kutzneria buriramensis]|nr:hypothetical protein [Kutzneria buriramensis]